MAVMANGILGSSTNEERLVGHFINSMRELHHTNHKMIIFYSSIRFCNIFCFHNFCCSPTPNEHWRYAYHTACSIQINVACLLMDRLLFWLSVSLCLLFPFAFTFRLFFSQFSAFGVVVIVRVYSPHQNNSSGISIFWHFVWFTETPKWKMQRICKECIAGIGRMCDVRLLRSSWNRLCEYVIP